MQRPLFVVRQRFGGQDGDYVIRCGFGMEVHRQLGVPQLRRPERRAPGDLGELGAAEAEQPFAIAQQAVEDSLTAVFDAGAKQNRQQVVRWAAVREIQADAVQQVAEGALAVGVANRAVDALRRLEVGELAVMREAPVLPPQLANERMGIDQRNLAHIGVADVADHHFALDEVALHHLRHFGLATRDRVLEQAQAATFIEGDAPAVLVRPGLAASA